VGSRLDGQVELASDPPGNSTIRALLTPVNTPALAPSNPEPTGSIQFQRVRNDIADVPSAPAAGIAPSAHRRCGAGKPSRYLPRTSSDWTGRRVAWWRISYLVPLPRRQTK